MQIVSSIQPDDLRGMRLVNWPKLARFCQRRAKAAVDPSWRSFWYDYFDVCSEIANTEARNTHH